MKRHVLHPLWVALGVVGLILFARLLMVPDDFGVHGDSFTYNFYRLGSVEEESTTEDGTLREGVLLCGREQLP